jgi:Ca2+-binding EF-hand superfamily protein
LTTKHTHAQIEGIFARADQDGNAEIDFEEFMVCHTALTLLLCIFF